MASYLPGKGADNLIGSFDKSLQHDLASTASRSSIHVKNTYKNAEKVINSSIFESTVDGTTSFVGGVIGEGIKDGLKTNNTRDLVG